MWWRVTESNRGHEDFQSSALPTELTRREMSQQSTHLLIRTQPFFLFFYFFGFWHIQTYIILHGVPVCCTPVTICPSADIMCPYGYTHSVIFPIFIIPSGLPAPVQLRSAHARCTSSAPPAHSVLGLQQSPAAEAPRSAPHRVDSRDTQRSMAQSGGH